MTEILDRLEPIMPLPPCPHCGQLQILDVDTFRYFEGKLTCHACKGRYHVRFGDVRGTDGWGLPTNMTQGGITMLSEPKPLGDPELLKGLDVPAVPKELYQDFEDAVNGLGNSPARAVAVLCRYAVQRALMLKGVPDEAPEKMVNIARQKVLISEKAMRQAMAAVFLGGKGAHPQSHWTEQVEENDAKQAVLVTRTFLIELFIPGGLST